MSLRDLFEVVYLSSAILLAAQGKQDEQPGVALLDTPLVCGELLCTRPELRFESNSNSCSVHGLAEEELPVCRASRFYADAEATRCRELPIVAREVMASAAAAQNSSRRGLPAR